MESTKSSFGGIGILFLSLVIGLSPFMEAQSQPRTIGGYVDQAEDRFVRNVWNFVKNFQSW